MLKKRASYIRSLWTDTQIRQLQESYGKMPCEDLAALVGHSKSSTYQKAVKLSLATKHVWATDEQIEAAFKELHPQGYSDAEIAVEVVRRTGCEGVDRHRCGQLRKAMGLPSNSHSARQRARTAAKTQQQIAAGGLMSLADLRVQRWNKWKRDLGWPEELTVRAVQSLEMFYRHGPLTRLQLCKLLGVNSKKRTAPISNVPGGTVLAELSRAGLIGVLKKAVPCGKGKSGKVKRVDLYFLNPGVEPKHEQRAQQPQLTERRSGAV